jgi:hypothetical protein
MNHLLYTPCAEWEEQLAATHPDDLSPSQQQALERHVASCTACAAVRAEDQEIDTLLLNGENLEPLPDLPTWRLQPRNQLAHVPTMSADEGRSRAVGRDMEESPKDMRLPALADRCMSEINNYRRGEASSDQYCLEIFRRAMQEQDDEAWTVLVERFQEFLLATFRRHPMSEAATHLDNPENYVARAFERFWTAAMHTQQVTFTSLGGALRFLRLCLNSVILDTLRPYARRNEVPLPVPNFAGEPAVGDQEEGSELWKVICDILSDERERRLAFLLYYRNLRPRDIARLFPREFPDVNEIYRLRRNIVDLLGRNGD